MRRRALVAVLGLLPACAPGGRWQGPRGPFDDLRDDVTPVPVVTTGALSAGSQATFGTTSVVVESATPVKGRTDLRSDAFRDVRALLVAAARFEGPVALRVRGQSDAISGGIAKVGGALDAATSALDLVAAAATIFAGPEEPIALAIGAESHGRPWRAHCATATGETALRAARRSLTCALVRFDARAPTTWHIQIETVHGTTPPTRGWLRREPASDADVAVRLARPDTITNSTRQTAVSMSSFTFQKGGTAVANLQVGYYGQKPQIWLAPDATEGDEREAVEVTAAILALVPWDEIGKPDTR